jgi:type IV secretory pathway VirB2 component (pilin)
MKIIWTKSKTKQVTNRKMKNKIPLLLCLLIVLIPRLAVASDWQVDTVFGTVSSGEDAWGEFLDMILNVFYGLIGAITIVRIVYGGYRYMQASGNPQEAKAAKRVVLHALYGLVLVFTAYIITSALLKV